MWAAVLVRGVKNNLAVSQLVLLVQDLLGIGLAIIREARDGVAFSFLDGSVNGELKLSFNCQHQWTVP